MAPASTPVAASRAALIAAHRFGLGEPTLAGIGNDAHGWLLAQIGPADAQRGTALATAGEGIRRHAEYLLAQRERRTAASMQEVDNRSGEQQFVDHFRELVQADVRAHLLTAATSTRPFAERLALFWSNHFTVSMTKASARGLVGAFEREAIRPNIAGTFEGLLKASVKHAGMLRYLDNELSAGPHSRVVQRLALRAATDDVLAPRITGLNENLAREVLELHTLGAHGGYTQADVTAFARVLTGWRAPLGKALAGTVQPGDSVVQFEPAWHEPGSKFVLGKSYPEGPDALDMVLHDLAQHPATARVVASKLARHFVADDAPPALVEQLATAFTASGGDLPSLYRALLASPQAWAAESSKLKTPLEFVVSSTRLLGLGTQAFARQPDAGISTMGQRVQAAPSPAGWPDRAEDWLGPDAVWKRVEWASRVAERLGAQTDARALARSSLGPALSGSTAQQIDRAADGPQALALLLLSPEFQRR
jgi:uncharacterized protein (DUF1800 family)